MLPRIRRRPLDGLWTVVAGMAVAGLVLTGALMVLARDGLGVFPAPSAATDVVPLQRIDDAPPAASPTRRPAPAIALRDRGAVNGSRGDDVRPARDVAAPARRDDGPRATAAPVRPGAALSPAPSPAPVPALPIAPAAAAAPAPAIHATELAEPALGPPAVAPSEPAPTPAIPAARALTLSAGPVSVDAASQGAFGTHKVAVPLTLAEPAAGAPSAMTLHMDVGNVTPDLQALLGGPPVLTTSVDIVDGDVRMLRVRLQVGAAAAAAESAPPADALSNVVAVSAPLAPVGAEAATAPGATAAAEVRLPIGDSPTAPASTLLSAAPDGTGLTVAARLDPQ